MNQLTVSSGTILLLGALSLFTPQSAAPVPLHDDPKGYQGIPWGASLVDVPDMVLTRTAAHVKDYEMKNGRPSLGGVPVETVRFYSVDDQFARVTVRYRGEQTHRQILHYLERQFGPLERIPGQMMRGLNQQYTWRGSDTEINLTYEAGGERGFVSFDSRNLAPRFNDNLTDSAE